MESRKVWKWRIWGIFLLKVFSKEIFWLDAPPEGAYGGHLKKYNGLMGGGANFFEFRREFWLQCPINFFGDDFRLCNDWHDFFGNGYLPPGKIGGSKKKKHKKIVFSQKMTKIWSVLKGPINPGEPQNPVYDITLKCHNFCSIWVLLR